MSDNLIYNLLWPAYPSRRLGWNFLHSLWRATNELPFLAAIAMVLAVTRTSAFDRVAAQLDAVCAVWFRYHWLGAIPIAPMLPPFRSR